MEAANESARHAVYAVVDHTLHNEAQSTRFRRTHCDVWDPEDHELEDLSWFKELDEKLVRRGLPHMLEILNLDSLTDRLLRGCPADPLDPIVVAQRIRRAKEV